MSKQHRVRTGTLFLLLFKIPKSFILFFATRKITFCVSSVTTQIIVFSPRQRFLLHEGRPRLKSRRRPFGISRGRKAFYSLRCLCAHFVYGERVEFQLLFRKKHFDYNLLTILEYVTFTGWNLPKLML